MHPYQPEKHHRRYIRLKGYDYSQAGLYFITIRCQNRIYRFGEVVDGKMALNKYGEIAYNEWLKLSERFFNFELDVFQIMPNHIHGIILLHDFSVVCTVGAGFTPTQNDHDIRATARVAPTVNDIVGAYKSLVANGCLEIWKSQWAGVNPVPIMGKLWQRNYYEHIIRNEQSYQTISNYIINNPAKWTNDKFYNQ